MSTYKPSDEEVAEMQTELRELSLNTKRILGIALGGAGSWLQSICNEYDIDPAGTYSEVTVKLPSGEEKEFKHTVEEAFAQLAQVILALDEFLPDDLRVKFQERAKVLNPKRRLNS